MKEIPISPIQKHYWIKDQLYPGNIAYNTPSLVRFNSSPDKIILEQALNILINRHECLRTSFGERDCKIYQQIFRKEEKSLVLQEFFIESKFMPKLPEIITDEINRPVDLKTWPVVKFRLYHFKYNVSLLLMVFPEILMDQQSKTIFASELSYVYNTLVKNESVKWTSHPGVYSDFSMYHHKWLNSSDAGEIRMSWKQEYPAGLELPGLPYDSDQLSLNSLDGKRKHFFLGKELSRKMKDFARSTSINSFTVLLTSYSIFLHKLSNQNQIVIGLPLSLRGNENFRNTLGNFTNIQPIIIDFSDNPFGTVILRRVRMALLKARRKKELPLYEVNKLLQSPLKVNSIIKTIFSLEPPVNMDFNWLPSEPVITEQDGSQYDLAIRGWEDESGYRAYFEYSGLFLDSTITGYFELFKVLTSEFIKNPAKRIGDMGKSEKSFIMPVDVGTTQPS